MKRFIEDEHTELKEEYTENIKKEIIAFANTSGGTIYLGVNDEGCVIGLKDAHATLDALTNSVRDTIKPDVTMFINYDFLSEENKEYIAITVQKGTASPYYLAAKGLKPAGVFVRQGASSVPASETLIRQMIRTTDGELFENMRSLEQDLSFEYTAKVFEERKLPFGYIQMVNLGMIKEDTIFTNLALLFSDQCPHIIKAATFKGIDQEEFQDRVEFSGSLLKQLDDAFEYLDKRNNLHGSYKKLLRIDTNDYPTLSMRETLLNAIVHRDYSFIAPTIIGVYDDRMEFVSIGGLLDGVSYDAIMLGLSVCRNPKLANVFFRLRLIEAYGTGIAKILSGYKNFSSNPKFIAVQGAFKVILPNVNYTNDNDASVRVDNKDSRLYSEVMAFIEKQRSVARQEIQEAFGLSLSSCARILRQLVKEQVIEVIGKGRNTRYVIRK